MGHPSTSDLEAAVRADAASKRRSEIGAFLRSRREALRPLDVGLPAIGRRRTPGLRREEVAQLADVSVTWYTWLETGREANVSPAALERIASALHLMDDERRYLRRLAGIEATSSPAVGVSAIVQAMLDDFATSAAYVTNARLDILAANGLATELLALTVGMNVALQVFCDPAMRSIVRNWEKVAGSSVAILRLAYATHLEDSDFVALISELQTRSADFARMWAQNQVVDLAAKAAGARIEFDHPKFGQVAADATLLTLAGDPDRLLFVVTPAR